MIEIPPDKLSHALHILTEAQRRYEQTSELIDELCGILEPTGEQEQLVANAVFQNMTISQLVSNLEIKVTRPHAEDTMKYSAKDGWKPK